ncbi:MAG: FHA domain-containing protein, partial [Nannocystaceae bacterium]
MSDVVRPVKRKSGGSSSYPMAGVTRYLLVLDGETSTRIELHVGEFRIGGPGADLEVSNVEQSVAVLRSSQSRVLLTTASSAIPLRINGHAASRSQVLTSGDTLKIAGTIIVFQSSASVSPLHQLLD